MPNRARQRPKTVLKELGQRIGCALILAHLNIAFCVISISMGIALDSSLTSVSRFRTWDKTCRS